MQIDAPAIIAAAGGVAVMAAMVGADTGPPSDLVDRLEAAFEIGSEAAERYVFDTATGELRPAAAEAAAFDGVDAPAGAALVMVAPGGAADDLYLIDMATGEARPLVAD